MDLANASAMAYLRTEDGIIADVRVALGSAAPRPVRSPSVEVELLNRPFSEH